MTEDRIRHADDGDLGDARQRVDDVLDFLRRDLLAARLDDVVLAADEVEEALSVGAEKIARVQHALPFVRAGAKRAGGGFGVLPVALHDVCAANDELAHDAGRGAVAGIVDDVGFGAGNGDADREMRFFSSAGGSQVQRLHSVSPYME